MKVYPTEEQVKEHLRKYGPHPKMFHTVHTSYGDVAVKLLSDQVDPDYKEKAEAEASQILAKDSKDASAYRNWLGKSLWERLHWAWVAKKVARLIDGI